MAFAEQAFEPIWHFAQSDPSQAARGLEWIGPDAKMVQLTWPGNFPVLPQVSRGFQHLIHH